MSTIRENPPKINYQFDPPLVNPDFFGRARCAGCSVRLIDYAALVPVPTNIEKSRIVPLCADCYTYAYANQPTGKDLAKALSVWDSVARYLRLEDAKRANKAVQR